MGILRKRWYSMAVRIYFCGAISAGRAALPTYQHIVNLLKRLGHSVLTEHVARPDVADIERHLTPREVYERDLLWLRQSEAVIAEVSTPSLGVGYEIARALSMGKPTLCLFRDGLQISRMITGNGSPGLTVASYRDEEDLNESLFPFLSRLQPVSGLGSPTVEL